MAVDAEVDARHLGYVTSKIAISLEDSSAAGLAMWIEFSPHRAAQHRLIHVNADPVHDPIDPAK